MTEEQLRKRKLQRRKKRRRKRFIRKCILATVSVGAVVVAFISTYYFWNKENKNTSVPQETHIPATTFTSRPKLAIDLNAGEKITPTPAPTEPGISIAGWSRIEIPSGVLEANVSINNPKDNEGWYYLTYQLRLKETNEVVFTTGLILPGMYCNKVSLTRSFEPGEYPAILHVQPYRMDEEQSPTNNAELELLLIVK